MPICCQKIDNVTNHCKETMIATGTKVKLLTNVADPTGNVKINLGTDFIWNAENRFQDINGMKCQLEETDIEIFVSPLEDLEGSFGDPFEDYLPDEDPEVLEQLLELNSDRPALPVAPIPVKNSSNGAIDKLLNIIKTSDKKSTMIGNVTLTAPIIKTTDPKVKVVLSADRSRFKVINSAQHPIDLDVRKALKSLGWKIEYENTNAYQIFADNVDEDDLEICACKVQLCFLTNELLN